MKKKVLALFFIFLFLCMPASEASKKMFACDLTVSRISPDQGDFTIKNIGNRNSPASGFDVMMYYKKVNDTEYKKVIHINDSIAPGYSKHYNGSFTRVNSVNFTKGLIRVNPYKKFQEWSYDNNVRYFGLIAQKITSMRVDEYCRVWDWVYDEELDDYVPGWVWCVTYAAMFNNGAYSPIKTTPNPYDIGGWEEYYAYVNAVIFSELNQQGSVYMSRYITVSGIPDLQNFHVIADVGYDLELKYNPQKSLWDGYVNVNLARSRVPRILIYSDLTNSTGSADLAKCKNITVKTYRMCSYVYN